MSYEQLLRWSEKAGGIREKYLLGERAIAEELALLRPRMFRRYEAEEAAALLFILHKLLEARAQLEKIFVSGIENVFLPQLARTGMDANAKVLGEIARTDEAAASMRRLLHLFASVSVEGERLLTLEIDRARAKQLAHELASTMPLLEERDVRRIHKGVLGLLRDDASNGKSAIDRARALQLRVVQSCRSAGIAAHESARMVVERYNAGQFQAGLVSLYAAAFVGWYLGVIDDEIRSTVTTAIRLSMR